MPISPEEAILKKQEQLLKLNESRIKLDDQEKKKLTDLIDSSIISNFSIDTGESVFEAILNSLQKSYFQEVIDQYKEDWDVETHYTKWHEDGYEFNGVYVKFSAK